MAEKEMKNKKSETEGVYIEAIGRRKTATSRVRLWPDKEEFSTPILINDHPYTDYFSVLEFQKIVEAPLALTDYLGKIFVSVKVKGGGMRGQAEATRLGIARALVKLQSDLKPVLKKEGFLTRDPRKVERKKPGLRKARRAQQWRKR